MLCFGYKSYYIDILNNLLIYIWLIFNIELQYALINQTYDHDCTQYTIYVSKPKTVKKLEFNRKLLNVDAHET